MMNTRLPNIYKPLYWASFRSVHTASTGTCLLFFCGHNGPSIFGLLNLRDPFVGEEM